jgi:diguanylate cyclase
VAISRDDRGESANQNSYIADIKNEYRRIDTKWLSLHYRTSVGLVIFAFVVECILGLSLYFSGGVSISLERFLTKYLFAPLACNVFLVLFGLWAMRTKRVSQDKKVYIISLLFVAICFVFFSVHSIFDSLYLIFTMPIILTLIYSNYRLTTITAVCSFFAYGISELFVRWDQDKINTLGTELGIMNFVISLCILAAFYAACVVVIHFEQKKNYASIRKEIERFELRKKLLIDDLTEIGNRTALRNALEQMSCDSAENKYIFVMCDLNNFKLLNDRFGHDKGDQCLKAFADILKENCSGAKPFRFGGDEFCILFKNRTPDAVIETCRRIQSDLAKCSCATCLTASFGIAMHTNETEISDLIKKADMALYRSKKLRNTINVFNDEYDDWGSDEADRDNVALGFRI